jgi:dUTPase
LRTTGRRTVVGTASSEGKLLSLGRAEPCRLQIAGLPTTTIRPEVFRNLSHSLNLGARWLQENQFALDFSREPRLREPGGREARLIATINQDHCKIDMKMDRAGGEIRPKGQGENELSKDNFKIQNFKVNKDIPAEQSEGRAMQEVEEVPRDVCAGLLQDLRIKDNPTLQKRPDLQEGLVDLLKEYQEVFSSPENKFGHTRYIECRLRLKKNAVPVRQRLRPLNPKMQADLKVQLDSWLASGVVRPSCSEWATPLVPIRKKDGTTRWACDFRALNEVTEGDAYPLPRITETLHKLKGARVFSSLDCASAYWTIPLAAESCALTAFITPFGLYEWVRMPFGLKQAGAVYSRYVSLVLRDLGEKSVVHYLDDVLGHTEDEEQHLDLLRQLLKAHHEAGLRLNAKKTFLFQLELEFLGHRVSEGGIGMIPSYVQKIVNWPRPQTGREMMTVLGFFSYYRSYVSNFASYTREMNAQRLEKRITWTAQMAAKFDALKQAFQEAPIRAYPDYESRQPFRLTTDWSGGGLGAILSQIQAGRERLIGAASRKTTKYESNYPSYKGELSAIILGLRKYKHILLYKPFQIYTDSSALKHLVTMKEPTGIMARWLEEVQQYEFTVFHKPGKLNLNADALSRASHLDAPTPEEEQEGRQYVGAVVPILDRFTIKSEQLKDQTLQEVARWEKEGLPSTEDMRGADLPLHRYKQVFASLKKTVDGIWFFPYRLNHPTAEKVERLLVPLNLQDAVFRQLHHHKTAGHFGGTATVARGITRFYWPNMAGDLRKWVALCNDCITKSQRTNPKGNTYHPRRSGYPFQRVYVDLVGPMPETGSGNKYILTCEDSYTRWCGAFPIPNKEASTVARNLVERWVCMWGCPYSIFSDSGGEFTGLVFKEAMDILKIQRSRAPAYNPSSNVVERFHRTLNQMLRIYMDRDSTEWAAHLPTALFAYNSKVHSATGISPYFALMGREPRLPVDLMVRLPEEGELPLADFTKDLKKRFRVMAEYIRRNNEGVISRNSHQYEGTSHSWKVGDLVWYFLPRKLPGKPAKLTNQWTGPFRITTVVAGVLVKITPANSEGDERIVHVTRLRPYSREDATTRTIPDNILYDDDEDEEAELVRGPVPAVPRTLSVPVHFPTGAPAIVERETLMQDTVEEKLPAPPPPPDLGEVADEVMTEEGGTAVPETQPVPSTAPMSMETGSRESATEPNAAESGPTDPTGSRRASLFKRRRPARPATSDTSAERQVPPWKRTGLFRKAADLGDSSMDEEIQQLGRDCAISVVGKLPGAGPADSCKLLAPVTQNLPAGHTVEVPLRLNLTLPQGWKIQLKEANGLTSRGIRLLGGTQKPGQPDGLTIFLANSSDKLFRIQQGQRLALARIHHHVETLPTVADSVEPSR